MPGEHYWDAARNRPQLVIGYVEILNNQSVIQFESVTELTKLLSNKNEIILKTR